MGGNGQPQTQASIFSRVVAFGQAPQAAIDAPRWLLDRTRGASMTLLRIESRVDPAVVAALARAGHDLDLVEPFTDVMGHAGMVVRSPDGNLEGAADPRSDGAAIAA